MKNKREKILQYFHKYNRPILIGEISSLIKLSLDKTEKILLDLSYEKDPEIRLASKDELKGTDIKVAYVLSGKQILAKAYDP